MDRALIERLIGDLEKLRLELNPAGTPLLPRTLDEGLDQALWLAGILAHSPDVISVLDLEGTLLYVSRSPAGVDPATFAGRHSADYVPPPFREAWLEALQRARETGEPEHVEIFSKGDYYWDTRIVPIKQQGQVTWLLTIGTDITAQRGAEAALALSSRQLELALEASGMGQWSWSIAENRVTWDQATRKIFDWPLDRDDIDFSSFVDRVHPADRERVQQTVQHSVESGQYQDVQCRLLLPDGTVRWIFCKGSVVKDPTGKVRELLGGVIDITHGKRTDDQLQRSAKLEAIGQLAGGVAHDFNNLLVAILGNLDLATNAQREQERQQRLKDAKAAANRAAELTRQLLVFGRRQPLDRESVDCGSLLDDTLRLLERLLPETIEVNLTRVSGLPLVFGDRGQIEQVLVNLCLNARDAMPEGGKLTVECTPATLNGLELRSQPRARPGKYLLLRVTDTGVGIPPDHLDRIFEPFFTTKPTGTGLGLASAYGIVQRHGGFLQVESNQGRGTSFNVYLPAIEGEASQVQVAPDGPIRGGYETVLLAEDEPAVRAVVTRMLERVGYQVVGVMDGQQAVERFLEEPEAYSLLLFDAVMPKKGGAEALSEIRKHNTDIPAILCSGYTDAALWQNLPERVKFVSKPYEPDRLLSLVRNLLDQARPDAPQ